MSEKENESEAENSPENSSRIYRRLRARTGRRRNSDARIYGKNLFSVPCLYAFFITDFGSYQQVRLLKSLIPTASNAEQINDAMESTFPFRQYQMKKNLKTPSLILAEYPRMVDFNNGLLVI
jgi:hypothetical protein